MRWWSRWACSGSAEGRRRGAGAGLPGTGALKSRRGSPLSGESGDHLPVRPAPPMPDDTPTSSTASASRGPLPLVAAWLVAMLALALWRLPSPAAVMDDPAAVARWEAWWRTDGRSLAAGAPLLGLRPCACGAPDAPVLPGDIAVAHLPDPGPEALLFDANGRLRYAGPVRDAAFCGGGSPLQAVAARLDLPPTSPLLIDAACDCPAVVRITPPPMDDAS